MEEETTQLLMNFLIQLPMILASLAGIILAIALWGRKPTASVLVVIGCALAVLMSAAWPLIHYWIGRGLARGDLRGDEITTFYRVVGLISSIVFAGALGLLVAAAFVGRRKPVPMATVIG